jgi:hypothetical protein
MIQAASILGRSEALGDVEPPECCGTLDQGNFDVPHAGKFELRLCGEAYRRKSQNSRIRTCVSTPTCKAQMRGRRDRAWRQLCFRPGDGKRPAGISIEAASKASGARCAPLLCQPRREDCAYTTICRAGTISRRGKFLIGSPARSRRS